MTLKSPQMLKGQIVEQWEKTKKTNDMNVVEATQIARTIARWGGISMFDMVLLPNDRIQIKRSNPLSIAFYVVCVSLFVWCTYYSTVHRQSVVLGVIYDSILGYNGEHLRTAMSAFFVFYVNLRSFDNKAKVACFEETLKLDRRFIEMGVRVDCAKMKRQLNLLVCAHVIITILLSALLYFMLSLWNAAMPLCKVFQLMYTVSLTMHCLITYYYGARLTRDRHRYLNEILTSILETDKGKVAVIYVKPVGFGRASGKDNFREATALDNIVEFRKIHCLLHRMCKANMNKFGMIAAMIICSSFITIILHIFYVMEATARGLCHDYKKYIFFIGYNAQQILFAFACIFFIVYASESVYAEISRTPGLVHDIINQKISPKVTEEASLLSLQLMHVKYKYTAKGLFDIDYSFLLSIMGSITTYLIILLQFATNTQMDFKNIKLDANYTSNSF